MRKDIIYQLALKYVQGIGDINARHLINFAGSAEDVFKLSKSKLEKIPGIRFKTVQSILNHDLIRQAELDVKRSIQQGVQILSYLDSEYPARLKQVNDAPLVLFYKGASCLNNTKTVGIVGTRKATTYGKRITEEIISDLVPHGALIVSGLAYGIDVTAHRGALNCKLPTVGVMAGGLDKIYPAMHKKTVMEMLEQGGIISEQVLGTTPEAHYFPARNRIIAGMVDALIVVEAADKGGALITAEIAHSYDRDVFAVPGEINSKYSEGCNRLIAMQKANIYTQLQDLEYLLNWDTIRQNNSACISTLNLNNFPINERKILEVLLQFKKGMQLDELSWKTQIPVNTTMSTLLKLEFEGLVKTLPGKTYVIS